MRRLLSILALTTSLILLTNCSKDDSDSGNAAEIYSVDYIVDSLGDVPKYTVVTIDYISDNNYYDSEYDVETYPWSYSARNMTCSSVTMKISFEKRVPYPSETLSSYSAMVSYTIGAGVQDSGDYSQLSSILTTTKYYSAESWESHIDNLVKNPIVITLSIK